MFATCENIIKGKLSSKLIIQQPFILPLPSLYMIKKVFIVTIFNANLITRLFLLDNHQLQQINVE